ncbi:MAG: ATP synthase F0 subunit C [Oscillospiraceae bacterium]|nr:ATP synthase F0 subunit C [Oscillospiraceae bacterium]
MGGTIAMAVGLMMAISVAGAAIAQSLVAGKTMESMARQPELAGKLQTAMILALGLIEALCIYALLIAFMLVAKI